MSGPSQEPDAATSEPRAGWILILPASSVVFVLLMARLLVSGEAFSHVWAEDGLFLSESHSDGLASLFITYSGYGHLLPRLIAQMAAVLPLSTAPYVFVIASGLVAAALAGTSAVIVLRATLSRAAALIVLLGCALLPALSEENLGNVANLQTVLIATLVVVVVLGTEAELSPVAAAVVAFVAVATQPISVLAAVLMVVSGRSRTNLGVIVGSSLGLLYQLAVFLVGHEASIEGVPREFDLRLSTPRRALEVAYGSLVEFPSAGVFATVIVVLIAAVLLYRCGQPARTWAAAILGFSLALALLLVVTTGAGPPRYASTAGLIAVTGLAVAVGGASLRWPVIVGLLAVLFVWILDFPATDYRLSGPSWQSEVRLHEIACEDGRVPPPLEVSPSGWGSFRFPC